MQSYFDFGDAVAQDSAVARKELAEFEIAFNRSMSPLPKEPNFEAVEQFLQDLRVADPAGKESQ